VIVAVEFDEPEKSPDDAVEQEEESS